MPGPVIDIQDMNFSIGGQPVLTQVRFQVQPGDFVAVIGPNGGGKTTLLKLMLGLFEPEGGSIRILGRRPREASHQVGYVPQDVHLNKEFPITVMDVVLMGRLRPSRRRISYSARDRSAALDALDKLQMGSFARRRIGELSGGQRQRVYIARALAGDPQLLFLDEPTANIDPQGQSEFYDLLKELNREITILLVSHDVMMLSAYVKSVACVNQCLHHHHEPKITGEMIRMHHCPVDLIAHGHPHRVFEKH